MAVEARHLGLLSPQHLANRETTDSPGGYINIYGNTIAYGMTPISQTKTMTEALLPIYGESLVAATKAAMKADSALTCALPVSRKRAREVIAPSIDFPNSPSLSNNAWCGSLTFLGEDISLQIQQQQFEIDRFIAQHTEKVRSEIEERRKQISRRIVAAVQDGIIKKLKAKEEEIKNFGKLNWALEERVKSLYVENQIWRNLAQTNETTANALRSNLDQVLAQYQDGQGNHSDGAIMDDAQSCCGSNSMGNEQWHLLAESSGKRKPVIDKKCNDDVTTDGNENSNRWCKNCVKKEACVLLLPCRHLCLCTVCGSMLHTCPVCKSTKNASLHVNMYES